MRAESGSGPLFCNQFTLFSTFFKSFQSNRFAQSIKHSRSKEHECAYHNVDILDVLLILCWRYGCWCGEWDLERSEINYGKQIIQSLLCNRKFAIQTLCLNFAYTIVAVVQRSSHAKWLHHRRISSREVEERLLLHVRHEDVLLLKRSMNFENIDYCGFCVINTVSMGKMLKVHPVIKMCSLHNATSPKETHGNCTVSWTTVLFFRGLRIKYNAQSMGT